MVFESGSQNTLKPYAIPIDRWIARAAGGTSQRLNPGPATIRSRVTASSTLISASASSTSAQTAVIADVAVAPSESVAVTITGQTRNDAAFATGYAHAQDRYFQMDLARRMSAGRRARLVTRSNA